MRDTIKVGSKGATVRELQTLLNTVGAHIAVDGDFGDDTFQTVCDFQEWKKLEPDGVVGPKTWAAIDQAVLHHEIREKVLYADKLVNAGRKAIERATALWQTDIYDPKRDDFSIDAAHCKDVIGSMIRGENALGWSWEGLYSGDGDFQWCGAFAAYCWGSAVKQPLRQTYFSSTYRLDRYASYRSVQGETNVGKGRVYACLDENSKPEDVPDARAGDILVIGPSRDSAHDATWHDYGNHICLVEDFDGRSFRTIEGNGNGTGPTGARQQGVVRGRRNLGGPGWVARRLIRPSIDDLV